MEHPAARERFGERGRMQAWLEIVAALARAQADVGLVPAAAAEEIAATADVDGFDLEEVAAGTRESGHSTLGIIRAWQRRLSPAASEWIYWGATVQDVTDTWTGLVMRDVLDDTERDLERLERALVALAREHRETVVLGRTHGQPGLPITFGFKAAVWTAEVRRHRERIAQARPRVAVGQLAGAVGTCSFWGEHGLELQRRMCERLGLAAPDITWLTARDRVAEFLTLLAMVTGTRGEDRPRGLRAAAPGDRRARGGDAARARRLDHDAAQAQPGAVGAPRHAVAGRARRRPASRSRGSSTSTSATARRGRPSGRTCPRRAS